ncbi:acetyl-CoA acetyltransferase [Aeromicrobium sp. HA]|uniref:acetyl-CoA acetyltransferase n=1 Tax=Aeromicrobium sp. HA TaxID=3009077 RepID=UPI0022B00D20|nr:acetyl-CoA acetyltransferase [Aeromicrobium sp. HA]
MSAEGRLSRQAAIVGLAEYGCGVAPAGLSALDITERAAHLALDDAGLTPRDVDAVFSHSAFYPMPTVTLCERMGIDPHMTDSTATGGSSFLAHVRHAAAAIHAGLCEVALIAYGSNQRSAAGGLVASGGAHVMPYETPFGPRLPVSGYALAAARHMHQYGTTREDLAEVAVAARQWAQLNPAAFAQGDLTINDVMQARMVSSPLSVLDCCLVTDGGGAVVMTSAERALDLPQPAVHYLGGGEALTHVSISQMPDLTVTAAAASSDRAFAAAGLRPSDVDVVELYDAFTINVLLFLEDLGFCAKGEAGDFVRGGGIAPGGRLPVNTNGGGLSFCHPGMYGIFTVTEAALQLRGQAGDRQVADAAVALAHGNGGVLSSQATVLLGSAATR